MIPIHVEALFISIPPNETIPICLNLFFEGISSVHGFTKNVFSNLLEFSVFNSTFFYNKKFYKHIVGMDMGLPLSLTLTNIIFVFS